MILDRKTAVDSNNHLTEVAIDAIIQSMSRKMRATCKTVTFQPGDTLRLTYELKYEPDSPIVRLLGDIKEKDSNENDPVLVPDQYIEVQARRR